MNSDSELIKKALHGSNAIADKLKRASSIAEIEHLKQEIEAYSDFIDTTFGIIDDDDPFQESNCDLSLLLYLAVEAKIRHISYSPQSLDANNYEIEEFEEYLDGRSWLS